MVQVSGGALTRKSSVAPSIKNNHRYGKIGSTQFLEQGSQSPALFLLFIAQNFVNDDHSREIKSPAHAIDQTSYVVGQPGTGVV